MYWFLIFQSCPFLEEDWKNPNPYPLVHTHQDFLNSNVLQSNQCYVTLKHLPFLYIIWMVFSNADYVLSSLGKFCSYPLRFGITFHFCFLFLIRPFIDKRVLYEYKCLKICRLYLSAIETVIWITPQSICIPLDKMVELWLVGFGDTFELLLFLTCYTQWWVGQRQITFIHCHVSINSINWGSSILNLRYGCPSEHSRYKSQKRTCSACF